MNNRTVPYGGYSYPTGVFRLDDSVPDTTRSSTVEDILKVEVDRLKHIVSEQSTKIESLETEISSIKAMLKQAVGNNYKPGYWEES